MADQDLAFSVLAGVPSAYHTISTLLTSGDNELKIDEILPKLQQTEQMLQPESNAEAALLAKRFGSFGKKADSHRWSGSGQPGSGQDHRGQRETRTCYFCKKPGHVIANCRKKQNDEQRGNNSQQKRQLGAIALTAHNSQDSSALAAENTYDWVLDTGASRHITPDSSILLNARRLSNQSTSPLATEKPARQHRSVMYCYRRPQQHSYSRRYCMYLAPARTCCLCAQLRRTGFASALEPIAARF